VGGSEPVATVRIALQRGQIPPPATPTVTSTSSAAKLHCGQEVLTRFRNQANRCEGAPKKSRVAMTTAGITVSGIAGNALAAPGSANLFWGTTSRGPAQNNPASPPV